MKKILFYLIAFCLTVSADAQIIVSGEITTNTTWTKNNIYLLDGWVYVRDGAVLTIEPGTLIKGDFATKGSLIIERGAQIIADGTAEEPIVFTSQKAPGQRAYGDWGGVIICGRASVNTPENAGAGTSAGEAIIEGGVGSIYGGGANPDDNDNSGILRYVRIEFGGIPFQPNSEINGLTCGGVGRGTTIDHVMVSYSGDDAFEWFGGTVNATNLISYRNWDDDFDTDFGFTGNIQFGLIVRDPAIADQSGSNAFESDNDGQGTANIPVTHPKFSNITVVGPLAFSSTINSNYKRALHLRRNTRTSTFNSVFVGYPTGLLIDGSTTQANATNNDLRFKNSALVAMNDTLATTSNANPNNINGPFNIDTWFNATGQNNSLITSLSELMFNNASLEAPDLTLISGSPLEAGANFSDGYLSNPFFTPTSYRGAFGTENWTACWAEWDPQNAPYNSATNYTITCSIDVVGESQVCVGENVTLMANSSAVDATHTWSNGMTGSEISVSGENDITLHVVDGRGCSVTSAVVSTTNFPEPEVTITANGSTSFCTGGSVELSSSQSSGNEWSNDATSQSITVSSSGDYSLTYTDENGCEATSNVVSVSVSDSPAPTITTNGSTEFCEGSSVELTASLSDSYQWNLNGSAIENATGQTFEATEEGVYTVTVTNEDQCDGTGTSGFTVVTVNATPAAGFDYDLEFGSGTIEFNNNSTNALTYNWDFGDGFTSSETNPTHTFTDGGTYEVVLTATNGDCSDIETITIANVSVENQDINISFVVFPNPVSGDATAQVYATTGTEYELIISDITGKLVSNALYKNLSGQNNINIPSSGYDAGIYFVQIKTNRILQTTRLVVR
jgi:PKD repeat protein